jgi:predicted dehydrogenase
MSKTRVGVVGIGRLGGHHSRWYHKLPSCELVGVYDTQPERSEAIATELTVTAFDNLERLLENVDALSIVTPTSTHHEVALQALERGKHVLIEKPIAPSVAEAQELIAEAAKNNCTLTVGHIERFNPATLALEKTQKSGLKPRFIEAHRLAAFNPRATDVAVILDLMVHDIDLALHFVQSEVKALHASAVPVISEFADIANVRIEFENGAVANLTASRISLQAMRKMRIFGRENYYALDFAAKTADLYNLVDSVEVAQGLDKATIFPLGDSGRGLVHRHETAHPDDDMLCQELEAFLCAVAGEAPVAVSGAEALAALEVALEVERVAQAGRLVD